jgi:hypothetical protein
LRGQPADFPQGERDLRFRVERRMTTREYQPQPIVAKNLLVRQVNRAGGVGNACELIGDFRAE